MTDLMTTLYQFVQEHRIQWVCRDPEYRSFAERVERKEQALRDRLDEEENKLLDAMLDEQLNQTAVELEAVFQAAVALCRELNGMLLL